MAVADLPRLAALAHDAGALLAVDSTFATPAVCQPLRHGVDLVIHSATKYLGGHSDATGGVVVGREDLLEQIRLVRVETGGVLAPDEAFLLRRGLETLPLRMVRHCSSALALAEAVADHPAVARVDYPGLPGHPGHDLAEQLFLPHGRRDPLRRRRSGSCRTAAGKPVCASPSCSACPMTGASLGGTHTLVGHAASTTHRQLDERRARGRRHRPGRRPGLGRARGRRGPRRGRAAVRSTSLRLASSARPDRGAASSVGSSAMSDETGRPGIRAQTAARGSRWCSAVGARSTRSRASPRPACSRRSTADAYDVVPVGITTDGRWVLGVDDPGPAADQRRPAASGRPVRRRAGALLVRREPRADDLGARRAPAHVRRGRRRAARCCTDRTARTARSRACSSSAECPYVGSGIFSSAACMDKHYMKVLLAGAWAAGRAVHRDPPRVSSRETRAPSASRWRRSATRCS